MERVCKPHSTAHFDVYLPNAYRQASGLQLMVGDGCQ
jgi:hypothetical protein